mmetsp:Transcript_71567/g.209779  ORF Transcript_71567/g.209779 Transcript_71567/m.209779 type:complete len:425 (+) Transcript_71567:1149-2423(+)
MRLDLLDLSGNERQVHSQLPFSELVHGLPDLLEAMQDVGDGHAFTQGLHHRGQINCKTALLHELEDFREPGIELRLHLLDLPHERREAYWKPLPRLVTVLRQGVRVSPTAIDGRDHWGKVHIRLLLPDCFADLRSGRLHGPRHLREVQRGPAVGHGPERGGEVHLGLALPDGLEDLFAGCPNCCRHSRHIHCEIALLHGDQESCPTVVDGLQDWLKVHLWLVLSDRFQDLGQIYMPFHTVDRFDNLRSVNRNGALRQTLEDGRQFHVGVGLRLLNILHDNWKVHADLPQSDITQVPLDLLHALRVVQGCPAVVDGLEDWRKVHFRPVLESCSVEDLQGVDLRSDRLNRLHDRRIVNHYAAIYGRENCGQPGINLRLYQLNLCLHRRGVKLEHVLPELVHIFTHILNDQGQVQSVPAVINGLEDT